MCAVPALQLKHPPLRPGDGVNIHMFTCIHVHDTASLATSCMYTGTCMQTIQYVVACIYMHVHDIVYI